MNIDFTNAPGFSAYVLLLIASGIVMLAMLSTGRGSTGLRALNLIFGAGFVVYGCYLAFFFQGGSYVIFFKAFILPAVMVIKTVRSAVSKPQIAVPAPVVEPSESAAQG